MNISKLDDKQTKSVVYNNYYQISIRYLGSIFNDLHDWNAATFRVDDKSCGSNLTQNIGFVSCSKHLFPYNKAINNVFI